MTPEAEMALNNLRQSAKPILFDTGLDEAPYSGAGTGFLALFRDRLYLLTADHVIKGENLDNLLVFPNDKTDESIPFDARFSVVSPDPMHNDHSDLSIVRVALDKLDIANGSQMHAIRLDTAHDGWKATPFDYQFAFFGYPKEARGVDYEGHRVASTQHFLVGRLARNSGAQFCFELEVDDFNGVSDLDGLSGSPVVAIPRTSVGRTATICGMAIRGSKTAGRIRFIEVAVLRKALEQAMDT
jgi:hypothetical protein